MDNRYSRRGTLRVTEPLQPTTEGPETRFRRHFREQYDAQLCVSFLLQSSIETFSFLISILQSETLSSPQIPLMMFRHSNR